MAKKANVDWVVMGGSPGDLCHCTRCGEGLSLNLPQPIRVVTGAANGFIAAHSGCKPGQWKEPVPKDPRQWARGRDVGISSGTIYAATTGNPTPCHEHDVPHDPSDFGRCYRFLKLFLDLRPHLHKTVRLSKKWEPFVEHWDELTRLYELESPTGKAPKLYLRIKELGG